MCAPAQYIDPPSKGGSDRVLVIGKRHYTISHILPKLCQNHLVWSFDWNWCHTHIGLTTYPPYTATVAYAYCLCIALQCASKCTIIRSFKRQRDGLIEIRVFWRTSEWFWSNSEATWPMVWTSHVFLFCIRYFLSISVFNDGAPLCTVSQEVDQR